METSEVAAVSFLHQCYSGDGAVNDTFLTDFTTLALSSLPLTL